MREILFRGKCKDTGKWYKGQYIHLHKTTYCFKEDYDRDKDNDIHQIVFEEMMDWGLPNRHLRVDVIPETVGQFTGLTDKNDKKIFEGDIVQYTDEEGYYPEENCDFIGKISLEHGAFGIVTTDNIPIDLNNWCDNDNFVSLWELYWNLSVEGEMLDMVEVIGNIHDNPELLKGGVEE